MQREYCSMSRTPASDRIDSTTAVTHRVSDSSYKATGIAPVSAWGNCARRRAVRDQPHSRVCVGNVPQPLSPPGNGAVEGVPGSNAHSAPAAEKVDDSRLYRDNVAEYYGRLGDTNDNKQ